jgi:hypothetical protein
MNAKKSRGSASSHAAYRAAIKIMRGEWPGNVAKAMAKIRATPRAERAAFTARTWPTRRAIYGPSGRSDQGRLFDEVPF